MSYHLFIVACAGAGATVIALVGSIFWWFIANMFLSGLRCFKIKFCFIFKIVIVNIKESEL